MKKIYYVILFFSGIVVALSAASFQPVPGHMDASYYYANGIQLAGGEGYFEPFIWNYLGDPTGIPQPSHTYWMPLSSLVSSAGILLTGSDGYFSARILFLILAATLPPLTAFLAIQLSISEQVSVQVRRSVLAGLLALFPGFYLIFSTGTETFTLYMILGSLFLTTAFSRCWHFLLRFLCLGVLAGLMHLTRADGILWLAAAICIGVWYLFSAKKSIREYVFNGMGILLSLSLGYLAIMMPWYLRNLEVFGSIFPPGGSLTLWLIDYDQTFVYPSSELNFQNWLDMGWKYHLHARLDAFWLNIKTLIGVQGLVFLLPLIVSGLWKLRHEKRVILAFFLWAGTFGIMSFVFPYAGTRGGFFHSGAALQPFFWALAPIGLESVITAGSRWRGWDIAQAERVFQWGVVGIAGVVTVLLFSQRVLGTASRNLDWSEKWEKYEVVEQSILEVGALPDDPVLVNNPPMYFAATRRPALSIPDGDIESLLAAAERYGASYFVLEDGGVEELQPIYDTPGDSPGVKYLFTVEGVRLYEIIEDWE
jgi:hypothetical protein